MKKILTIAGSDSSGGAGIQADLKTMTVHGMYGMSVITALTAQNTTGVYGVLEATPDFVGEQLDCVFKDIRPDAVKIGMVSNADIIKVIADKLIEYKAENIVVDPVMVATSGGKLMQDDASATLIDRLLPLGTVITPNIPEAEALSGMKITSTADMQKAAELISKKIAENQAASRKTAACQTAQASSSASQGGARQAASAPATAAPVSCTKPRTAILIKGGHFTDSADDLLYIPDTEESVWFRSAHIDNQNTHGTGCTLSSAIACRLAEGHSVTDAVKLAKDFITGAISAGLNLGSGSGPLNHMYQLK